MYSYWEEPAPLPPPLIGVGLLATMVTTLGAPLLLVVVTTVVTNDGVLVVSNP